MRKAFAALFLLALTGVGCKLNQGLAPMPSGGGTAPTSSPENSATTTITYYVPDNSNGRTKYCGGGEMSSEEYKKTLTVEVSRDLVVPLTLEEKINRTLTMAVNDTDFWNSPYTRVASTTYENGVVTVRPAGGFAGVSLFMCAWQPFVEKQLEQFSEVKQIKWEPVS